MRKPKLSLADSWTISTGRSSRNMCREWCYANSSTKVAECSRLCKRFQKIFPNVASGNKSRPIPYAGRGFRFAVIVFHFFPPHRNYISWRLRHGGTIVGQPDSLCEIIDGDQKAFSRPNDWLLKNVTRTNRKRGKKLNDFRKYRLIACLVYTSRRRSTESFSSDLNNKMGERSSQLSNSCGP